MSDLHARKVMIIGLDAPMTTSLQKYMKKGVLPNMSRLKKNGVWADNCLVPHPTITPPNWTTIVTGAWAGTHGVTCFNVHVPGDPLDKTHQGFLAEDNQAEFFWNAAAREGKRCILMNYPTTYPKAVKKGIQIAGAGLGVNEWRTEKVNFQIACSVSADLLFATEEYPMSQPLRFNEAKGWKGLPEHKAALEAELPVEARMPREPVEPQTWYLCLLRTRDRYDTAVVATARDGGKALATLKVGQWSPRIVHTFNVAGKKKKAAFHLKLLELSRDGKSVKLYVTPLCQLDGWASPASVCKELEDIEGLPIPNCFYGSYGQDWFDIGTLNELIDMQNRWFAEAALRLTQNHPWDIFCMHAHAPDHCYHVFASYLDPAVCKDKKLLRMYQRAEQEFYESLDRMIGRIVEHAGKETVVVLTSDHGAVPTENMFEEGFTGLNVNAILKEAGLLCYKEEPEADVPGPPAIDWAKTRAFAQRSIYVYVNLKGRDPDGIVSAGKEYEEVVDKVIESLRNYRDPLTGRSPFAFVLRKADARILGLYGDRVGDVVYGVHGWVQGEHGRQVPTAEYGIGSMRGLFLMSGPGVKRGVTLTRNVWLTDIVPTVCYLTGFPVPRDAEGAVIYQALENPDGPHKESALLRKNLERFKRAAESERMLTHRYEH